MASHWKTTDEERVKSAAGALDEASRIVSACAARGPCPLSEADLEEGRRLAAAASILLGRIGTEEY